jgi:hypothetical protein
MNVGKKIGAEAAQFPEKEYINGIAVAVYVVSSPHRLFKNSNSGERNTTDFDIGSQVRAG